jgi:hypothetical protein
MLLKSIRRRGGGSLFESMAQAGDIVPNILSRPLWIGNIYKLLTEPGPEADWLIFAHG